MNCSNAGECETSNYKVVINPDMTLSGYAWSANIGWIQFGGLSGFPAGGGNASIVGSATPGWKIQGWARALAYGDGWDGWISFNCSNSGSCATSNYAVDVTVGSFGTSPSSYAWGADVVGWTSFSTAYFTPPCTQGTSCTTDYSGTVFTDQWCVQANSIPCPSGEVCLDATNSCTVVNITGTLIVNPILVKKQKTVEISWSLDNPSAVDSCHVESNFGGRWDTNNSNSGPITFSTNIFTLYCVPAGGGPNIEVDTKTVKLLPSIKEI